MSLRPPPDRRRPRSDDEDEEPDATNPSPASSNKRLRLSPAQDVTTDDEENQSDSSDVAENSTQAVAQRPTAHPGIGPDGYKVGAIKRIKVTNFVTYTQAEFFPGPKLNMVIGPNGTGKSTLVCAICLGLGWGPQHLGRAKDLGEFVKHGCQEATIEIELAGQPKFSSNPVICRTIKRDGNKSFFTVNGRTMKRAEVLKFAQSFAIQVDNLCQFLPQDKVAEFAALTPIDLLHSTQRAAAGPLMTEWHGNLKMLRAEQKRLELNNRADKEVLTNLENRQNMQRPDVERMRQRDDIERKIQNLEFLRPVVEYQDFFKTFNELKETRNRLEQEYKKLNDDLAPAMQALTSKQTYIGQIEHVRTFRKNQVNQLSHTAADRGKRIEELQTKIQDLNGQIEAQKKGAKKHQDEAQATRQSINRLKRQEEEEPVEFDPDFYNEQLREKRLAIREIDEKGEAIQNTRNPLIAHARRLQSSKEEAERQLRNLDSQSGQQEHKLQRRSQDSFRAYRWIRDNQDKFEKEVFGPPIVTCSVKDPKYADMIESLFQRTEFVAFTTQSKNDFRTLQRALIGELKLHDVAIRTCAIPLDSMRAPLPDSELRRMGFDGWAKDYLDGPEPVLAMLCSENRLNQTPVTAGDITDEVFDELQNLASVNSWVTRKHVYNVTRRREYGNASSTRARQVRAALFWTSQPVDTSLKQQYQQKIMSYEEEKAQLEQQEKSRRAELAELRKEKETLDREADTLENEKVQKQTAQTQYKAIPEKILQQEAKLENLKQLFAQVRETVGQIRSKQDDAAIQKAEATLEYADSVDAVRQAYEELIKTEIQYLEATSDVKTLQSRHHDHTVMLDQKREETRQAMAAFREGQAKGRQIKDEAKRVQREVDEHPGARELHDTVIRQDGYNMDQLNADIDSEKARLELTHGGSTHMIKEFEERERQIQKLHDKLADFQTKLDELQSGIDEVRGRWEPRLDALVSKISEAFGDSFARIGCAGQVTLDKVEDEPGPNGEPGGSDFDQWSIQIHVKFREHESLSLLDSHRQSGGERAVSTIFYLMALQSLSASPFRVVDEINQGMDPRNERMVHGRLVEIACASSSETEVDEEGNPVSGAGGGQYFLITPKLLDGLVYRPGMRVLCIYSGEHQPAEYQKLDFKRAIDTMRTIAGQNGRAVGKSKSRAIPNHSQVDVYA